jgi:transposase-like protein
LDVSLPGIDSKGDTVKFGFSEQRNLTAAKRFLRKALKRHGQPERIVIDGSPTTGRPFRPAMPKTDSRIAQDAN